MITGIQAAAAVGIIGLVVICIGWQHQQRCAAYAEYKKRRVRTAIGRVLQADCSIDSGGKMRCTQLVVAYTTDSSGTERRQTFRLEPKEMSSSQSVPQVGSKAVISWTRGNPESAMVALLP